MHNADLYEQNNGVQKRDALACLEKYASNMKWKKKGNRIIDIGCGDGTVTNMLKKYLPNDYKLLGVDISEGMVNFAYDHHCNENTSYAVLDIEDDLPDSLKGKFNHVFSFYTLHWIQNQNQAFENIFNLLEHDGQCFMTFLASNPIYDAFRSLSRRSKWSNFLLQEDVEKFVCPYHDLEEPDKEVRKIMKNIGYNNIEVECEELTFTFDNLDDLRNHLRTINPFKIPKNMYDDLLDDLIEILQDIGANQIDKSNKCVRIDYKLLIVYGHKPDIEMS